MVPIRHRNEGLARSVNASTQMLPVNQRTAGDVHLEDDTVFFRSP
jgi:hypothetical protein